jgi:hypothetical protein
MTSISDLEDFIKSKGYNPKGYDTEIPDDNDLWDIIDENGWMKYTNIETKQDKTLVKTNSRGMFHSTEGPARIYQSEQIIIEEYYINGILHRLDGPAKVIDLREEYYFKGELIANDSDDYHIFLRDLEKWEQQLKRVGISFIGVINSVKKFNELIKPFYDKINMIAEYGDLEDIKKYLDLVEDKFKLHWIIVDIFHISIELGHLHVFNYLFDIIDEDDMMEIVKDIDIDKVISFGRIHIIEALLDKSIDAEFDRKIFNTGSLLGQLEIVKLVVQKGSLTVDELLYEYSAESPIQLAASAGHYNILEYFFNINPRSANNVLALSDASEGGHLNVVKLIIETVKINNPNIFSRIIHGEDEDNHFDTTPPLVEAVKGGNLDIVKFFIETIWSEEGEEGVKILLNTSLTEWNLPDDVDFNRGLSRGEGINLNQVFSLFLGICGPTCIPEKFKGVMERLWFTVLDSKEVKDTSIMYTQTFCYLYNRGLELGPIIAKLLNNKDLSLTNLAVLRRLLKTFKEVPMKEGWMIQDQAYQKLSKITMDDIHKACTSRTIKK